jgi:hypothetical protein
MSGMRVLFTVALLCCIPVAFGQNPAPPAKRHEQEPKRPVTPRDRITAAKTALVRNAVGSDIPFNVISSAMESWGRFQLVNSPEKADIIIEVSAPGTGSGMSMSSSLTRTGPNGHPEQSTTATREITNAPVRIIVYDARSHVALWSASEQPKHAMKQKSKEDNLVQASERLFDKFRDSVEPNTAQ